MPPDESQTLLSALDSRIRQSLLKTDIRTKFSLVVMAYGQAVERTIAEALRVSPDLLVVMAASLADEAHRQAAQIPIVFKTAFDPVATGLVETAIRPGRNMTGYSNHIALYEKRWELMAQAVPNLRRIGVLLNQTYYTSITGKFPAKLPGGIDVVLLKWQSDEGLPRLEQLMRMGRIDALDVGHGVVPPAQAGALIDWALGKKIPTMFYARWYVERGGLLAYEAIELDRVKMLSDYVVEILHGSSAGGLPVSSPNRFSTSINAHTAKILDIRPPSEFLKRIDYWKSD